MPKPIPPHKRKAILTDIRAGEKSCRQIARDHRVAASTVSDLAKTAGVNGAFERSLTKKATEAATADHRARLVALAGRYALLAETVLASFEAMTPAEWAKASMHSRAIIAGIAADKAKDLAPDDSGVGQVASALGQLLGQFTERHGTDD